MSNHRYVVIARKLRCTQADMLASLAVDADGEPVMGAARHVPSSRAARTRDIDALVEMGLLERYDMAPRGSAWVVDTDTWGVNAWARLTPTGRRVLIAYERMLRSGSAS